MKNDNKKERDYIYHMIRDVVELNGIRLKPEHKTILFCLESRGKDAFPSHETLAENCGIGETKLKEILKILKEAKIIDWTNVMGSSNRYKINRQLIAESFTSLTQERVLKKLQESEQWESFHKDWDIAGVAN